MNAVEENNRVTIVGLQFYSFFGVVWRAVMRKRETLEKYGT